MSVNFSKSCIRSNVSRTGERQNNTNNSISDFYNRKSVFITGATGFLGKMLVEKLLYETNPDKLFLLIRNKTGESIHQRLDQMLNNPIFDRLKETRPSALDKIVPIVGDIAIPDLGIKRKDANMLSQQVSIVFHTAATVMFDEPLKVSLNLNYEGTKRVMDLAHVMKRIESFVHVSSTYAYAFDGESTIKESLYPPPENHEELDDFVAKYNDNKIETKKFLQRRANTYTYTKAMAETCIVENHGKIPTCIVRPSVITAKMDPPLTGWLDNWYGTTRSFYDFTNGWNRLVLGHGANLLDIIPVDYVANLCIIAATKNYSCVNVSVYNSCSSGANQLKWRLAADCFIEEAVKHKLNALPYPFVVFENSKFLFPILSSLIQLTPARIADSWLWTTGRKPKYTKTQKKVIQYVNPFFFFSSNSWLIECDNARRLFGSLSASDQKRFPCDPINIDWKKYLRDYYWGIHRYLLSNVSKKEK